MKKAFFIFGIIISLLSTGLMFDRGILFEITTNIATVLLIIGIGLIATQRRALVNGGD